MSLSERYDYLKAAKASIYNNVREEGIRERGGSFEDQRGIWESKGDYLQGSRGKGTGASVQKGLAWWGKRLHPMGRKQPSAMALLSRSLRPQHSLWPLPVTPAFGDDKVAPPGYRMSRTPGTQVSLAPTKQCCRESPSPTQDVLQDSSGVCL